MNSINPAYIKEYRLIGYENRILAEQDFDNDAKDAGDFGAGHTVTVLYELRRNDGSNSSSKELKYQSTSITDSKEWTEIKIRYKKPESMISQRFTVPVEADDLKTGLQRISVLLRVLHSLECY